MKDAPEPRQSSDASLEQTRSHDDKQRAYHRVVVCLATRCYMLCSSQHICLVMEKINDAE